MILILSIALQIAQDVSSLFNLILGLILLHFLNCKIRLIFAILYQHIINHHENFQLILIKDIGIYSKKTILAIFFYKVISSRYLLFLTLKGYSY
ncbi:hypothetical protein FGO68_gene9063 [Halteria grandinella]|uniref:Uncharacterized protein n=1 Tax=Halteria grandinella TaxID=5974 RepID=A0A8J8P0E5_HALGN|nr:hypothetical protein FGO68_gene9063 [Halteria grandinella]